MDYHLTKNDGKFLYPILPWMDFMRLVGALLVTLAHVDVGGNGPFWADRIFYTISRNGVPLFFMMSGFLLLSKEEDLLTFFRKRGLKILIPFLVWSAIYEIYNSHPFAESGVSFGGLLDLLIRILRGPRATHLWFFYSLIGLYFFTPILRHFVAHAPKADLLYVIVLWFFITPFMYILEEYTSVKIVFETYFAVGYIGYFLLGHFLGGLETSPRLLWIASALFAVGFVSTFAVFYFDLPPQNNEFPFRSYPSINIVVMAIGAYLLLKAAGERMPAWLANLSSRVSPSTFGIYLVHSFVLVAMVAAWDAFGFATNVGPSILVIPIVALVGFLISWGITAAMRIIPILREIVP